MAVRDAFRRLFNLLAGMGLVLTDDAPKVIELKGREWGPTAGGLALSILNRPAALSVVLRNVSEQPISVTVPGWLYFYEVRTSAPLSPYGQALLKSERRERISITLQPGEATEADLPLSLLYSNLAGHRFQVFCQLPDGVRLASNEIAV